MPINSILQTWVMRLGLRHQGVIVSAMRGCDTAPRHDASKLAQRLMRGAVLEPHCGRAVKPISYIVVEEDEEKFNATLELFLKSWDHYPNHYVMHFVHACEIIGYYGPRWSPVFGERWLKAYQFACHLLHVNPETREQLDSRLNADEQSFKKMQEELHK